MTPRRQRMLAVGLALTGIALAAVFTLRAMKDNMMFFIPVSDVVAGEFPVDRTFRVGGLTVRSRRSLRVDRLRSTSWRLFWRMARRWLLRSSMRILRG